MKEGNETRAEAEGRSEAIENEKEGGGAKGGGPEAQVGRSVNDAQSGGGACDG